MKDILNTRNDFSAFALPFNEQCDAIPRSQGIRGRWMFLVHTCIGTAAFIAVSSVSHGQYIPAALDKISERPTATVIRDATVEGEAGELRSVSLGISSMTALPKPLEPVCKTPPSADDVRASGFQYVQTMMSRDDAAHLGLPVAKLGGSESQLVLVRDYSRGVPCVTADGRTAVYYGQAIRATIGIVGSSLTASASLAVVAADATINRKGSRVIIEVQGLANPKFDEVISEVAGKELTVETYGDFTRVESQLIKLISDTGTTQGVAWLGVVPDADEVTLRRSVGTAFALQAISDGKPCSQAVKDYSSRMASSDGTVEAVYSLTGGSCSSGAPTVEQRAVARRALGKVKVR